MKTLGKVLLGLLTFVLIVLLIAPGALTHMMWNGHRELAAVPVTGSEKVDLTTEDGLKLVGWNVPAIKANGDAKGTVVVVSGVDKPSASEFKTYAPMFAEHGFNTFLLEMRGHGQSEGGSVTFGHREKRDIKAAVDWLTQKGEDTIVVYGNSMGGSATLMALEETADIDAVITAGAPASFRSTFADHSVASGMPTAFATAVIPLIGGYEMLRFGPSEGLKSSLTGLEKLGDRKALIMHSAEDSQVPYGSFERIGKKLCGDQQGCDATAGEFGSNLPANVKVWTQSGDNHFVFKNPDRPESDVKAAEILGKFLDEI